MTPSKGSRDLLRFILSISLSTSSTRHPTAETRSGMCAVSTLLTVKPENLACDTRVLRFCLDVPRQYVSISVGSSMYEEMNPRNLHGLLRSNIHRAFCRSVRETATYTIGCRMMCRSAATAVTGCEIVIVSRFQILAAPSLR